jgi:hypothetical protein
MGVFFILCAYVKFSSESWNGLLRTAGDGFGSSGETGTWSFKLRKTEIG